VLALGQETDFYGSQLLIHKLPTTITAATITAATITAATITAATITAVTITAAITVAIAIAIATAIDTARRRRRRRNIDLAAGRRSDLAAAATVIAATGAHRAKERGTEQRRSKEEAKCFGLGRNGGGSECESCSGHNGYPA
jgi:MFS superfamily sulfate permease-like transporter